MSPTGDTSLDAQRPLQAGSHEKGQAAQQIGGPVRLPGHVAAEGMWPVWRRLRGGRRLVCARAHLSDQSKLQGEDQRACE